MRFLFLLFLVSTSVNAQSKAVAINLDVKLLSNDSLFQGGTLRVNGQYVVPDFYVPIDSAGRYTITFPKSGKYELWFSDTSVKRQSFYMNPVDVSIRKKKNKPITMQLQSRCYANGETAITDFQKAKAVFYVYGGIAPPMYYPNLNFEEKYSVSFHIFGCTFDLLEECALENNKVIAQLMDEKYGLEWRKELPYVIEGIQPAE
ncbi:MAG: hypothetical protein QE487_02950 [Fluviicola sp.]|nr:hypothetical protein [Fluviicola sp.]